MYNDPIQSPVMNLEMGQFSPSTLFELYYMELSV